MKLFLDQDRPLYTCREKDCKKCDVSESLNCHFSLSQLLKFLVVALPTFVIGGIGVFHFSPWALLAWGISIPFYFGLIEIRVMCSHCPHYAEPELTSLKCWANYGSPKIWRYRPGPMSLLEKVVFFAGLAFVLLFPIPPMIWSVDIGVVMPLLYTAAVIIGLYALRHFLCTKCMNFACPLNRVDEETRERFFSHNPVVGDAWKG